MDCTRTVVFGSITSVSRVRTVISYQVEYLYKQLSSQAYLHVKYIIHSFIHSFYSCGCVGVLAWSHVDVLGAVTETSLAVDEGPTFGPGMTGS